MALFPALSESVEDPHGSEALNASGLLQRTVRALKQALPELVVITDVALDPYSSDGHDGVVIDGVIDNDQTLPLLAQMAVAQADAGADVVAPSDMMDGRVGAIRRALDAAGHSQVAICSYAVKYALRLLRAVSRGARLHPRSGDKRPTRWTRPTTGNACARSSSTRPKAPIGYWSNRGCRTPTSSDSVRDHSALPVAAYHVSGEYAMLKAAAERGFIDYDACLLETLMCFRRAGADIIFTYAAIDAARLLKPPNRRT